MLETLPALLLFWVSLIHTQDSEMLVFLLITGITQNNITLSIPYLSYSEVLADTKLVIKLFELKIIQK